MPRLLPLALLLLATPAVAAPVPKVVLTAEQEAEFNDLWDGVDGRQSSVIKQFCRLVSQPDAAVAYIAKTVRPAKLDEKEAKQLISDLGSKDEAVWRAAARDLRNRDARLAITFTQAWDMANTDEHKRRLGMSLYGISAVDADYARRAVELEKPRGRGEKATISFMSGNGNGIHTGWSDEVYETFEDVVANRKKNKMPSDGDSIITCHALERIGTPAARNLLDTLAEGHPDASITVEATAALARMKKPAAGTNAEFDKLWKLELSKFIDTGTSNAFLNRPGEAVAFFKKNLVPVKLTKETAEKLLARLLSDDNKVVRAALRELQVADLALELNLVEEFEKLKTAEHRCRLATVVTLWKEVPYGDITDDFDTDERMTKFDYKVGTSLSGSGKRSILWKTWRDEKPGDGRDRPPGDFPTLCWSKDEIDRNRWYHEESAIYILDAIGTDDALAIIKDMATGHPDAGPTKAAKDVLKRRGVK